MYTEWCIILRRNLTFACESHADGGGEKVRQRNKSVTYCTPFLTPKSTAPSTRSGVGVVANPLQCQDGTVNHPIPRPVTSPLHFHVMASLSFNFVQASSRLLIAYQVTTHPRSKESSRCSRCCHCIVGGWCGCCLHLWSQKSERCRATSLPPNSEAAFRAVIPVVVAVVAVVAVGLCKT